MSEQQDRRGRLVAPSGKPDHAGNEVPGEIERLLNDTSVTFGGDQVICCPLALSDRGPTTSVKQLPSFAGYAALRRALRSALTVTTPITIATSPRTHDQTMIAST
jgi:hypothetical protein